MTQSCVAGVHDAVDPAPGPGGQRAAGGQPADPGGEAESGGGDGGARPDRTAQQPLGGAEGEGHGSTEQVSLCRTGSWLQNLGTVLL